MENFDWVYIVYSCLAANTIFYGAFIILFRNLWILGYNFIKEARRFCENIEFFDGSLKMLKDEVIQ
jgi:hypothetical protein